MLLLNHREIIGYEVNPSGVIKTMSLVMLLYPRQLLNKESDTAGKKKFAVLSIFMSRQWK